MFEWVWLIPLLPLLGAAWICVGYIGGWNRGESGETESARAVFWSSLAALLALFYIDILALLDGAPGMVEVATWLSSGEYRIGVNFLLDPLGLSISTLFALLSLITIRFSIFYMHREAGFQRFFLVLGLFNSAMLLITLAGNAVLMFMGWEMAGISSFLLIGYAYERHTATLNANRALVTNRIGDAGFLLGIAMALFFVGTSDWTTLQAPAQGLDNLTVGLIAGGFILAAMVKSAAVPFSPWISRALEGPTPSSAVFYGSVMVHAGVFLLLRMEPFLEQVLLLDVVLVIIGLLSLIYGWLGGLVQTDIKSALIYSTTAQIGLMFIACGLGWFEVAAWHLAIHAIWRSYQFLHAPSLLQLPDFGQPQSPAWLRRIPGLHNAALQGFWLEAAGDLLLVRSTREMAQDLQDLEDKVVNPTFGLPNLQHALDADRDSDVGKGRGVLGAVMERVAVGLHWIEERMVLRGGGEGLKQAIEHLGLYMSRIESLLSRPRYLLLLIIATFVVIL